MTDNRLEALAAFLAANPDLPEGDTAPAATELSLIHISEPTRPY